MNADDHVVPVYDRPADAEFEAESRFLTLMRAIFLKNLRVLSRQRVTLCCQVSDDDDDQRTL